MIHDYPDHPQHDADADADAAADADADADVLYLGSRT